MRRISAAMPETFGSQQHRNVVGADLVDIASGEILVKRSIAVVGAASSIGIRPYDDSRPRRLDLAPSVLREHGMVTRLAACDAGDVVPPAYRDVVRPGLRPRNEAEVAAYSRELAARIATVAGDNSFVLVLGGDCSIVLGCLLGVRQLGTPVGLVYIDAHADFASPEESRTGSAASMCLALAVGRGDTPLARLSAAADDPLVRPKNVVLIGRRDHAENWYGHDALRTSGVVDVPGVTLRDRGPAHVAQQALEHFDRRGIHKFWIHLDADVFDPSVVPAVDSPTPGGLGLEEVAALLGPLVRHPGALGMELTIYDPGLDPQRASAARLVTFLEEVLGGE
jgi:arginase